MQDIYLLYYTQYDGGSKQLIIDQDTSVFTNLKKLWTYALEHHFYFTEIHPKFNSYDEFANQLMMNKKAILLHNKNNTFVVWVEKTCIIE
jgi:hypothetical protein